MNIFEYLGLDADHRKNSDKVTQLVKHWDEVNEKHKIGKQLTTQVKRDGVCSLTVIKDGKSKIFSRTANLFTNTHIITNKINLLNMPDGVYMGEMWVPKDIISLEQLSGIVNPNRNKELSDEFAGIPNKIRMSWFDRITIDSFIDGHSNLMFGLRYAMLQKLFNAAKENVNSDFIDVIDNKHIGSTQDIEEELAKQIKLGEEGIVIRDMQADWEAGHKGWRVMKMVRGVDYDLQCVGYEEGKGKYEGKVANLLFNWKDGVTIKCMLGKGWTHQMAEEMFQAIKDCEQGKSNRSRMDNPLGKVFQVYALEESSKGKLRLAKVGEKRFDKDHSDI